MSRLRAVVCGTSFGRFYLRALSQNPRLELAGILSTGSKASARLARELDVPHYTAINALPRSIDLACVVVRAGVSGGAGAEVACALLDRGTDVLQEHPLHPAELADCLRHARAAGTRYAVNSFYPHVRPVACFLHAAALLRRHQPPVFIDGLCGAQVLYPLLDVAARAAGQLRPSVLRRTGAAVAGPYTSLVGEIGGIPAMLRVQNQIHPADADNHALLLHRLTVGFESGILALADTHGPVLWSPRLHTHRDATHRLVLQGPGTERLDVASSELLPGTTPSTFREIFNHLWPEAVNLAVDEFVASRDDITLARRAAQWTTGLAAFWQQVSAELGSPELITPDAPPELPLPALLRAEVV